ncbi:mannose-1-phosphate guanylyltransferase [Porphyromonas crevioricanis JCM 15906]|uniref:mannose-1-phosphate guanylyltransferase n=2 Tax=Porphyromonas crevioricanis TaxID=393921 RepID=A0AB34PF10_9PORP|nr:mannose-1-phosphate guanylyltransferase [Porphyromonas crevioricanis]KGN94171.1 mannose-1-phosphate guanylyltransferase [Porphyromonas crevioricanis]GAD04616.1 mannose-1-phosphate guanylyltransferase [Porphyromonas crevioricanis JCM 15906]SJZ67897.1 mannose-1-phosphate guanylyltransferase [Porphyromonas crevioricanis]
MANYCVIMGGGIGSRFWPFSREQQPKQFLDFFGTGRSLLQMTFDRFAKFIPQENIFVVTNEAYVDKVQAQLPEILPSRILGEPCRRNTAPCIAYAMYYIRSIDPQANVVVAPSDHLILKEEDFALAANRALDHVAAHPSLITLGIKPSRPETGYGYIQVSDRASDHLFKVKTFTEKPDLEMAKIFYTSGEFLWNSGMFVWNIATITEAFAQHLPEVASQLDRTDIYGSEEEKTFIKDRFPRCPSISIDYGVMEKAENVLVMPVDFGWADLGTWGALYELGSPDKNANVALKSKALFYEAKGNLVALDNPDRVVVVQGIDNCIVAESDNVLLICKQDQEQRIKHFVADTALQFGDDYN